MDDIGTLGGNSSGALAINASGQIVGISFTADGFQNHATLWTLGAHLWIGLKNSDDQGTQFDLLVEVLHNNNLVASGLRRCITGVTRNPSLATKAVVAFDAPFQVVTLNSGDTMA